MDVYKCRGGAKPDGVCCVVGSMASGFPEEANKSSDLIYSHSHITGSPQQADSNLQYFWEAFPAGSGPTHRTTYMFAYMDAGAAAQCTCQLYVAFRCFLFYLQTCSIHSVINEVLRCM